MTSVWTPTIERLRRHILVGLGSTVALACARTEPTDDAGITTNMSGEETAAESDSGSETEEPAQFCSVSGLGPSPAQLDAYGDCELSTIGPDSCATQVYVACVPAVAGQSCAEQCPGQVCEVCEDDGLVQQALEICTIAQTDDDQCCSAFTTAGDCGGPLIDGRPFMVAGRARVAAIREASVGSARGSAPLPAAIRDHLRAHWLGAAQCEHGSIASFARFAADLLVVGAPARLVAAASRAALDELRHGRAALALARRYGLLGGRFDALEIGADRPATSLAELVVACVEEGCVNETLAALQLSAAAQTCTDPEIAAILASIAEDESSHAALAWQTVQWALRAQPGLAPTVARAFARGRRPDGGPDGDAPPGWSEAEARQLASHGCLVGRRRDALLDEARAMIQTCATTLIEGAAAATYSARQK